ncbi:MAG: hypothetical protein AAGK38_11175 [Pseudomonadota bacterium]
MRLVLLGLLLATASPAVAGEWFQHRFGEARAYHGSWLAVCTRKGEGKCRAVQLAGKDGADGARRLAVHVERPGQYVVTIFQRGWLPAPGEFVNFDVDGETDALREREWTPGDPHIPNVAEMITVSSDAANARLVADLKAGRQARFFMGGGSAGVLEARFDLRGITAAINAIEARLARR